MARFNESRKGLDKTLNFEGAYTYKLSPELDLYTAVCCASLQPKFYEPDVETQLYRIRSLISISKVSPEFVSNLAIYAREQMYLRSIPLVLCVELARLGKLKAETVTRVIQRADEITELLSYYQLANERNGTKKLNKLSKAIEKGIRAVFESGKFDEYQYAKYNRKTEVRLRDALFLTHPKPQNEEQRILFKKIAEDTLETPYTWEVVLSERGNKKEVWEELIDSAKIGYMALLRNLRNILQAEVSSKHIKRVCAFLANPINVRRSKQLPFRFLAAYREIKKVESIYAPFVLEHLEKAIKASVDNVRGFDLDTTVLIACDVSGSMQKPISSKSKVQNYDIGLVLGMLLHSKCKAVITGMFGTDWKVIQVPRDRILANVDEFHRREGEVGYSTNGWKILDWLIKNQKKVDKIMLFTDNQLWNSESQEYFMQPHSSLMGKLWLEYKKIHPHAKIYFFDLEGYGMMPLDVRQNDIFLIGGWSDKVFDALYYLEQGESIVDVLKR